MFKNLLRNLLALALVLGSINSLRADYFTFNFTATDNSGVTATGSLTGVDQNYTINGNEVYLATAGSITVSGTSFTDGTYSLAGIGQYNNDNLFTTKDPFLDSNGLGLINGDPLNTILLNFYNTNSNESWYNGASDFPGNPDYYRLSNDYSSDIYSGTLSITPQATPEPASLALLAAGAPCMMLVRRLRRKAVVS